VARGSSLLLRVAWRNLGRNRRRTLIAGAAILLGVGLCIASFGLTDGMNADLIRSVTDVQLGHVQVHAPGFTARRTLQLSMTDAQARARAASRVPGVTAVSPRAYGWALATAGHESAGVELTGVDPKREARVTDLDRRVTQGRYLPEAPTPWPAARKLTAAERALDQKLTESEEEHALDEIDALGGGAAPATSARGAPSEPPEPAPANSNAAARETRELLAQVAPRPSAPPPLLLGVKLAHRLHIEPGARVTLMAEDLDGNPVDVDFVVVGVVSTGDPVLDVTRAIANLSDVQHFLALGDRAHELALRLGDPERAATVAAKLSSEPEFRGLDVRTWSQLRPDVLAMVQANSAWTVIFIVIVFAIAGIGVANTILMAVFDRRREFGVLRALGMRPSGIVGMVVIETTLLGLGASAAGLALGWGLDAFLSHHGIVLSGLSSFSLAGVTLQPVLHATTTLEGLLLPVALMLPTAVLASLWPATSAARTEPVEAMKER
jgi:lipoprotein-releasing system permease protein